MKSKNVKPCGEASPYWNWVYKFGRQTAEGDWEEFRAANMDTVAAPEAPSLSPELYAILEVIDEGGEQILSKREKTAFTMVVREGLSFRHAARKMGCSFHSVEQYVKRAAVKLRKLCQTKL